MLHGAEFWQEFSALRLRAESIDHPCIHVVDRNIGRGRGAALGELLEDDGGIEPGERRAADVVLDINAAEPQGGGFAQRLDRKSLALVPLPGKRHHVLARKRACHRLECALLLGKLEIHAAPLLPEAVAPRYHGRGVEWAKARNAPCLRLFSYI